MDSVKLSGVSTWITANSIGNSLSEAKLSAQVDNNKALDRSFTLKKFQQEYMDAMAQAMITGNGVYSLGHEENYISKLRGRDDSHINKELYQSLRDYYGI